MSETRTARRGRSRDPVAPSPVDAALLAGLAAELAALRRAEGPGDAALAAAVTPALLEEARLLDERRYRTWLERLADDVVYWVPMRPDEDPARENSIHLDDRRRLEDRIALTETGVLYAQIPVSRLVRLVANVEAWPGAAGSVLARANFLLVEHRRGRTATFAGVLRHVLVPAGAGWRIRRKVTELVDAEEPHGNLSFIL